MTNTNEDSTDISETWSRFAKFYDPLKIGSIDGTDTEPHDRAIVRAINSEYRPNKHVKGRPECTLFVSRLDSRTTKDTIKEVFSKFGRLKRFRLVKDLVTGFPKGYAFIEYETESAAEEAYRKAYKMNIDGNVIFVDFECERLLKGWKPRRLGGGFGGKKESGQLRFGGRDRPFMKPISLELKERENKLLDRGRKERNYETGRTRSTYESKRNYDYQDRRHQSDRHKYKRSRSRDKSSDESVHKENKNDKI